MKTYLQFISENIDDGLYTFRKLNRYSIEYLQEWMMENRIPNPISPEELHCTIITSTCQVPGYALDVASVMISPATYQIQMLNKALVLKFSSEALAEQWQRGMNLGAQCKWPSYIPHITLSYSVPETFQYQDLEPPPIYLILNEEESRKMVDGWASVNGLREGDESRSQIYVPQNSLNVSREDMPQIASANQMEFVDWLEAKDILVQLIDIPVSLLKAVQNELDLTRVAAMSKLMPDNKKPLIVSKDLYIVDGHHRWLAILNRDPHYAIEAYRVNLPIKELLQLVPLYSKTFYQAA